MPARHAEDAGAARRHRHAAPTGRTATATRRRGGLLIALAVAVLAVAVGAVAFGLGTSGDGRKAAATSTVAPAAATPSAAPAARPTAPTPVDTTVATGGTPLTCPAATVTVHTAAELTKALGAAVPGAVIELADGTYSGGFTLARSGTAARPLWLCGSRAAVVDGGGKGTPYAFHLDTVAWLRMVGFTVRDGRKGLMGDAVTHSVISGMSVNDTGDEAIHLRSFSTDNLIVANVVRDTGHRRGKFGEGVYIGSAQSNWPNYSGGKPDRSDRNSVIGNDIADTTAENIDIKEGTTGGVISDNRLSSAGMTDADSLIDVKGNDWTVRGNVGTGGGTIKDAIQTHMVADGWGVGNVIRANRLTVNAPGYGIYIHNQRDNTVGCDNVVSGTRSGFANVACTT